MKMTVDLCCFKFFNRDKKKVEEDKNGENSSQNCDSNENNSGADQNGHAKSNGITSRINCSNFDNDRPMSAQPISQQNKRTSIGQVRKVGSLLPVQWRDLSYIRQQPSLLLYSTYSIDI